MLMGLTFLGCLCGSEPGFAQFRRASCFLGCLCGSELD